MIQINESIRQHMNSQKCQSLHFLTFSVMTKAILSPDIYEIKDINNIIITVIQHVKNLITLQTCLTTILLFMDQSEFTVVHYS